MTASPAVALIAYHERTRVGAAQHGVQRADGRVARGVAPARARPPRGGRGGAAGRETCGGRRRTYLRLPRLLSGRSGLRPRRRRFCPRPSWGWPIPRMHKGARAC